MKVKELFETLKGKEDYDININYNLYDDFELEANDELKEVNIILIDEDENYEDDDNEYEEDQIEDYLYNFNEDDLIELVNKLDIEHDTSDNLSKNDLISRIINSEDEDIIKDTCEDLFNYSYDDFIIDNNWRHSNYESKDINDWDVDDHLAAWYDHMMEK